MALASVASRTTCPQGKRRARRPADEHQAHRLATTVPRGKHLAHEQVFRQDRSGAYLLVLTCALLGGLAWGYRRPAEGLQDGQLGGL